MIDLTEENKELLYYCADNNAAIFNMNKALEEAIEFQEVIVKLQTKHPTNKKRPDPIEAYKEYGDVVYRGLIALMNIFPEDTVEDIQDNVRMHIQGKLGKLMEWRAKGHYKGGL